MKRRRGEKRMEGKRKNPTKGVNPGTCGCVGSTLSVQSITHNFYIKRKPCLHPRYTNCQTSWTYSIVAQINGLIATHNLLAWNT